METWLVEYPGNIADLKGLTITATILQGDRVMDANVALENIEGQDCIEIIDAKYTVGDPVSYEMRITGIDREIVNNIQKKELGNFKLFPVINRDFGQDDIASIVNFPNPRHMDAYDISATSTDYPAGNHPVYAPCTGKVLF